MAHDRRTRSGDDAAARRHRAACRAARRPAVPTIGMARGARDERRQRGAVRLRRPSGARAGRSASELRRAIRSAASPAQSSPAPAISRPASICSNDGAGPFRTLNVFDLTTDIAPATGITGVALHEQRRGRAERRHRARSPSSPPTPNGIFASSDSSTVTINSTADIITTGDSATGIQGSGQNALLTITSSGNIATSGNNAFGIAAGTVYGDITSPRPAISRPQARFPPASTSGPSAARHHARRHHDQLVRRHRDGWHRRHRHQRVQPSTGRSPSLARQHRRVGRSSHRHQRADRRATSRSPRSATLRRGPDSSVGNLRRCRRSARRHDHIRSATSPRPANDAVGIYASAGRHGDGVRLRQHRHARRRRAAALPRRDTPAPSCRLDRQHPHLRRRRAGHHRLRRRRRRRRLVGQHHDDRRHLRRHQRRQHQRHGGRRQLGRHFGDRRRLGRHLRRGLRWQPRHELRHRRPAALLRRRHADAQPAPTFS